jgi:hypothetical protein
MRTFKVPILTKEEIAEYDVKIAEMEEEINE